MSENKRFLDNCTEQRIYKLLLYVAFKHKGRVFDNVIGLNLLQPPPTGITGISIFKDSKTKIENGDAVFF